MKCLFGTLIQSLLGCFFLFLLLFWLISQIRRALFSLNILSSYKSPKPVIIVGNLSVGGNGKTPVVVWLVEELQKQGLRVGVISRGYGSQSKTYPYLSHRKQTLFKVAMNLF